MTLPLASAQAQTASTVTALPAVTVRGAAQPVTQTPYVGGQVNEGGSLGILGGSDFMDTPFNLSSYTAQLIEDNQARTLADLVSVDPSVRMGSGRTNINEDFTIRGLPFSSQDVAFNGLYGVLPYYRVPLEVAQSVEILKGPSALLSGMAPGGTVAGAINIVPKRALDTPLTSVTASYWSDSQFGTHVDVGRRFGDSGQFGIRINGVYRDGSTTIDDQEDREGLLSVALDYRGERTRASLDILHVSQRIDNEVRQFSISPALDSLPSAPSDTSLNYPGYGRVIMRDTSVVGRIEHDINDDITVHAALGNRRHKMDAVAGNATLTGMNGDYVSTPAWQIFEPETTSFETGLTAKFATGAVKHKLVASFSRMTNDSDIGFVFPWGYASIPNNLYAPIDPPSDYHNTDGIENPVGKYTEATLTSYALADTLSFMGDSVQLTLGARHQSVKQQNYVYFPTPTNAPDGPGYKESAITPVVGLVVKPSRNLSLYANYIEGLSQGASASPPAVTSAASLPPMKTKQVEVGAKYDWGNFATTVSLYQIKRPSATVFNNSLQENGMQVNRGLEINAFGEVARDVRVLGGVTFMRGKLDEMVGGVNEGNDAVGVPHVQASLGVDWDNVLTPGLGLNARVVYTGSQYADQGNKYKLPSVTTFDVGARYRTKVAGKSLTLRLNVDNLFDKSYWATSSSASNVSDGYLFLGSGRIVMLSATMNF
ncbi:TonB-dependent receptor [Allopusillimonas soli]|uniref:TonB-dependent siderophore receptor n=1 Tax=Allopusillimonas soli TaxID=659016 RepID=A0A853FFQ0_9BURK|nr:TonB-dependent siderophore receptor [Allopusillimonas soli]NYT38717.1 TonB-dependent siderophore receptor [Allopusillimonas soli]